MKRVFEDSSLTSNKRGKFELDLKFEEDFSLPIDQPITENLNKDELEQSSLDTPIDSSNIGFKLLRLMGWKENTPLGKSGEGIIDPIQISGAISKLGIGKQEEDNYYTDANKIKRKEMENEKEETPELIKKREEFVEKEQHLKKELQEIIESFCCKLCNKQYTKATEWEAHLSSYDHNHKKRFEDMKQQEKKLKGSTNLNDKKKQKEQKKLEKEMQLAMKQATKAQQKIQQSNSFPTSEVSKLQPPPPPMNKNNSEIQQQQPIKFGFNMSIKKK